MQPNGTHPASVETAMTTNKDSNPPGVVHQPQLTEGDRSGPQKNADRYREGEELDPRNTRGRGDKRTRAQGRGNDPDLD
jgi:hypothetical protein